jgi:hypothetical protein
MLGIPPLPEKGSTRTTTVCFTFDRSNLGRSQETPALALLNDVQVASEIFLTDFFASAASSSRPSFSCSHILSGHSLLYGAHTLPQFRLLACVLGLCCSVSWYWIINGVASTRHLPRHASACTLSGTRKYVGPSICNANGTSIGAPAEDGPATRPHSHETSRNPQGPCRCSVLTPDSFHIFHCMKKNVRTSRSTVTLGATKQLPPQQGYCGILSALFSAANTQTFNTQHTTPPVLFFGSPAQKVLNPNRHPTYPFQSPPSARFQFSAYFNMFLPLRHNLE